MKQATHTYLGVWTTALFILGSANPSARSADTIWQATTDAAWENPANWSEGVLPGSVEAQTDTVIFGNPDGLLNPVLSTHQPTNETGGAYGIIQRVHFTEAGWTLSGDGKLKLQAGSGRRILSEGEGTNTIETDIDLLSDAQFEIGADNLLVLAGNITGSGSRRAFPFHGTGTARIEGVVANVKDFAVYGGGTVYLNMPSRMNSDWPCRFENGSTVILLADEQLRTSSPRHGSNAVLDLNGHTQTFSGMTFGHYSSDARFTTMTGESGLLRIAGLTFQPWSWNDRNRTGTVVLQGNVELYSSGLRDMTVVEQDDEAIQIRIVATISGVGGIRCRGDGTLQLTASNTYTGNTTVERASLGTRTGAGRLIIDGEATETASGTGMGTAAVTVAPTGLIGGSGTIGHIGRTSATLSLTGEYIPADPELEIGEAIFYSTVAPGGVTESSAIGALSVNGDVALGSFTRLACDLAADGVSDTLIINGALSIDATGTRLDLSSINEASLAGDYTLATFTSRSGEFTQVRFDGETVDHPTANRTINGTHHVTYHTTSIVLTQSPPQETTLVIR